MNKSNETVKISQKNIFALANKIRGKKHCDMKSAYAEAKQQLISEAVASAVSVKRTGKRGRPAENFPVQKGLSQAEVTNILMTRNANITYINRRGKQETTRATMVEKHYPTTRKAAGRRAPVIDNAFTFYDVRHGVFRTVGMDKMVSIQ